MCVLVYECVYHCISVHLRDFIALSTWITCIVCEDSYNACIFNVVLKWKQRYRKVVSDGILEFHAVPSPIF